MRILIGVTAAVIMIAAAMLLAAPAVAGAPDSPSCWGKASADLAQAGEMGEHASNPPDVGDLTPGRPGRAGIGNVARILGGDHPSDAAAALGADCP